MLCRKTVDLLGRRTELCGWADDLYFQTLDQQIKELGLFRACLPSNGVVFDIGANIGLTAVAAAQAGNRVFAFEPAPRAVEALRENAAGRDITIIQSAVGDLQGEIGFVQSEFLAGSHVSQTASTKVPLTRLDDWLSGLAVPVPNLIKIDAEGHEPHILDGACRTIGDGPLVLMEVNAFTLDAFGCTSTTALLLEVINRYARFLYLADRRPIVVSTLQEIHDLVHRLIAAPGPCWTEIAFSAQPKRIDDLLARTGTP